MPRAKKPCKRCASTVPGEHEPKCRYAKEAVAIAPPTPPRAAASPKVRKRVFTIDHADGSETTITVAGPAGAIRCNSTEQSVQVWTGENAPQPIGAQQQPLVRSPIVAHSTDVARSGQEYTITDTLDDVPGGTLGLSEEEASDPNAILLSLERKRLGMIGHMSGESSSSDVVLIPEGAN